MPRTRTFWVLIYSYCLINAGTCFFYVLGEPSKAVRWILAVVNCIFPLLLATRFQAFARKNALLAAARNEYYRQLEKDLKKQLDAGQKKTQFITKAYHEVRSHFWGVIVISRILATTGKKGYVNNMNKMLEDLSNASYNLELLLSNILDYAKYESGISDKPHYEAIDLRRNLSELVDIARYAAHEKNVRIEFHVSDEIPGYVVCDRVKINQVVTNLINNAIKFSNSSTNIDLLLRKDVDRLRISIKDQGNGIPPELLPNIFEQFVTTRQRHGAETGLGLGLYITRQLVNALQGEITVHSEENAGSCFVVFLPILPFESISEKQYYPSPEGN